MSPSQPCLGTGDRPERHNKEILISTNEELAQQNLLQSISSFQAVVLLTLLPFWVEVIELNLSPAYGSIPSANWRRVLGGGICFAGVATSLGTSLSARTIRKLFDWVPLIAFGSAWCLHAYLYHTTSWFGPVWGPFFTKLVVQAPLLLTSSIVLTALLKLKHQFLPWLVLIGIPWLFKDNTLMDLLSNYAGPIGSSMLHTRLGLLTGLALSFTLACPPTRSWKVCIRWVFVAALALGFLLVSNGHGPSQFSLQIANRSLVSSDHVILSRKESITGYISVLEDKKKGIRALRCDHSLLGGTWLVNEVSIRHGMMQPETLFSVFVMLEAVRLMVPLPVDQLESPASRPQNALVVGLGIGTSPAAFSKHGINTFVIEIDPEVTRMAREYFELPSEVIVYHEDALTFVEKLSTSKERYDYIVHDVFTGGAEPVSLFTKEFLYKLKGLLTPSGSIAVNYGGDLERESTWLVLRTIATTLGNCRAFRDNEPAQGSPSDFANFVVFCKPGQGRWTFRKPVEADFLGSLARRTSLVPQSEMDLQPSEDLNVLSSKDYASQYMVQSSQKKSAEDHWRIMRSIVPDVVWENW